MMAYGTYIVEKHRGAFFSRIRRPFRQVTMIGIPVASKVDPGLADPVGKDMRLFAAGSCMFSKVYIIEYKWYLSAMKRLLNSVQDRCLPCKQIHIDRRAILGDL